MTVRNFTGDICDGQRVTRDVTIIDSGHLSVKVAGINVDLTKVGIPFYIVFTAESIASALTLVSQLRVCRGFECSEPSETSEKWGREDADEEEVRMRSSSCTGALSFTKLSETCKRCVIASSAFRKETELPEDTDEDSSVDNTEDDTSGGSAETELSTDTEDNVSINGGEAESPTTPDDETFIDCREEELLANIMADTFIEFENDDDQDLRSVWQQLKGKLGSVPGIDDDFRVLLEIQRRNLKSDPPKRKWHPSVIQLCLTLWARNPQTCNDSRESGFLALPSGRLLSYKQSAEHPPGLDSDITHWMQQQQIKYEKEYSSCNGGIVVDDVTIKENLLLSSCGGKWKLLGFVDTGKDDDAFENVWKEPAITPQKMKRKRSSHPKSGKRKKKSRSENNHGIERDNEYMDFSSPKAVLESLLEPLPLDVFFQQHWEKKPMILKVENSKKPEYFQSLFSYSRLQTLLSAEKIYFERDVNTCRYVKGQRESLNKKCTATVVKINDIFQKKKGTIQFHQPQRFQDELWKIQSCLESLFNCLVGANVYITPGGSQGLAPHHDDVELEGEKHWRLYEPLVELPREYSRDLEQSEIGEPTHDFILKAGDVMYFPRGTIHQADTPTTCSHSTHVTISTYQHNTWGDLLSLILPNLLESEMDNSVAFRRGLPLNLMERKPGDAKETLKKLVHQLADSIESYDASSTNEMQFDFICNRLPPYYRDPEELNPEGENPTAESSVRLRFADHILISRDSVNRDVESDDESDDSSEDEDEADDGEMVYVYHSLRNKQVDHMMPSPKKKPAGLKFSVDCLTALQQLKSNSDRFMAVTDLELEINMKVDMLMALWSEGLLSTM
ncbi:ribosomal oxygenase 2-like isoform X2 [Ptychodera flava]|uniref:ribosomal oxygenase 2-like isoform X2 n=1 Tax=Ptychodera flava TaxID=63121 RepID=UPI00396A4010